MEVCSKCHPFFINVNFKFERMLLGALCTASLKTEGNVDPHSSAVMPAIPVLR